MHGEGMMSNMMEEHTNHNGNGTVTRSHTDDTRAEDSISIESAAVAASPTAKSNRVVLKTAPVQSSPPIRPIVHSTVVIPSLTTLDDSIDESTEFDDDGEEGDSEDDEDESDEEDLSPTARSKHPVFEPWCPFPLLFCLTLVGVTFILAGIVLLFGVSTWGVREESVAKYNHAIELWQHSHGNQMKRGAFSVVDVVRHQEQRTVFDNETMLEPVVENIDTSDPGTSPSTSSTLTPNANGLNDQGSDVHLYSPLYYEVLEMSPISWNENEDVSRFWSNLLNHDSRTLFLQTKYDGVLNSLFNLTIPFIKKEVKPRIAKTACESSMSGIFDRVHKTCTFFSQLHSICLRVKLLHSDDENEPTSSRRQPAQQQSSRGRRLRARTVGMEFFHDFISPAPSQSLDDLAEFDSSLDFASEEHPAGGTKAWSLDARRVGWEFSEEARGVTRGNNKQDGPDMDDSDDIPLTSLFVPPPTGHVTLESTNNTHAPDAASIAGCIWDDITRSWAIGEYHAVDIRSERMIGGTDGTLGGGSGSSAAGGSGTSSGNSDPSTSGGLPGDLNDPDALQPSSDDDEETRAAKRRLRIANLLRVTIRHTSDPFLLAQDLTANTLWFGLARTEKMLLSFVLGVLGMLFLIAPTMTLAQFLSSRTHAHFSRSKRARKGGYSSVVNVASPVDQGHRELANTPNSPSKDALIELESIKARNVHSNGTGRTIRASIAANINEEDEEDDSIHHGSNGFVPSAELRQSLTSAASAVPPVDDDGASDDPGHTRSGSVLELDGPITDQSDGALSIPTTGGSNGLAAAMASLAKHMDAPNTTKPTAGPLSSPSSARRQAGGSPQRIRIDPIARYLDPVHEPPSPSRKPPSGPVIVRRPGDLVPAVRFVQPRPKMVKPSGLQQSGDQQQLSKILSGNFRFSDLFHALSNGAFSSKKAAALDGTGRRDHEESKEQSIQHHDDDETLSASSHFVRELDLAASQELYAPEVNDSSPIQPIKPSDDTSTPWSSPRDLVEYDPTE